jgi:hypothetical protein
VLLQASCAQRKEQRTLFPSEIALIQEPLEAKRNRERPKCSDHTTPEDTSRYNPNKPFAAISKHSTDSERRDSPGKIKLSVYSRLHEKERSRYVSWSFETGSSVGNQVDLQASNIYHIKGNDQVVQKNYFIFS